jgi:hypothetical protein
MMTRNDSVSTLSFDVMEIVVSPCKWLEDETCNPARRALTNLASNLQSRNPFLYPLNSTIGKGFSLDSGDEKGKRGGEMMAKSRSVVIACFEV